MKAKDIFNLVVRILGLIIFFYGLEALFEGVLGTLRLSDLPYGVPKYWAVRGVIQIIFGLLVMPGTIPITELAFPEVESEPPEHNESVQKEKRDV